VSLSDELAEMTAAQLAYRIRHREPSPVEVAEATVRAIEADNQRLNAFAYLAGDQALERARAAERAVTAGEPLGPLLGVPTAMKDLFDFKPGWPTTFGGVRAAGLRAGFLLRVGGADGAGRGDRRRKTNSPVMGFRGTCDNPLFGPSRNPFDPAEHRRFFRRQRRHGGGRAAAGRRGHRRRRVGADPRGVVRGLRLQQSFGRVPYVARPNAFTGLHPFLFEGVLTRSVEDAALVIEALSGYDSRDPFALDEHADLLPAVRRPIGGWRIAYSPGFGVFPVEPEVAGVVADGARAF
jgi:amidase